MRGGDGLGTHMLRHYMYCKGGFRSIGTHSVGTRRHAWQLLLRRLRHVAGLRRNVTMFTLVPLRSFAVRVDAVWPGEARWPHGRSWLCRMSPAHGCNASDRRQQVPRSSRPFKSY